MAAICKPCATMMLAIRNGLAANGITNADRVSDRQFKCVEIVERNEKKKNEIARLRLGEVMHLINKIEEGESKHADI